MTDYIAQAENDAVKIIMLADKRQQQNDYERFVAYMVNHAIARNGGECNLAYAQRLRKACKRLALR